MKNTIKSLALVAIGVAVGRASKMVSLNGNNLDKQLSSLNQKVNATKSDVIRGKAKVHIFNSSPDSRFFI